MYQATHYHLVGIYSEIDHQLFQIYSGINSKAVAYGKDSYGVVVVWVFSVVKYRLIVLDIFYDGHNIDIALVVGQCNRCGKTT